MSRPAFTLLEVLLAISLLAAVSAAAFSWVATQTRVNRAAAQRLQALTLVDTVATAIRDDLLQALADDRGRRFEMDAKRLRLTTLNHMPGDPPGAQQVVWRQDERLDALVREIVPADPEAQPLSRAVSRRIRLVRFSRKGSGGTLMMTCRPDGQEHDIPCPLTVAGGP
jgi:prepilin-type N-terminal cleavage/methylation domain-containing protein